MCPFEDDDEILEEPNSKARLKKVSSQKSIFDSQQKKISQEDFRKRAVEVNEQSSDYKKKAGELALKYKKTMEDKTLGKNKSIFANEVERELISDMIKLAVDINNDSNEKEGMGSLSWITVLLKSSFSQRDKINELEYELFQLRKAIELLGIKKDSAT
jgi:hypothetical protein